MSTTQIEFIEKFSESLYNEKGVYFIGSGLSVPSSLPDWSQLIKEFVKRIGIQEIFESDDLPLLAQYYVNKNSKKKLFKKLNDDFSGKIINEYHQILNKTPLTSIWTTNYDDLLEKAFDKESVLKVKDSEAFNYDVQKNYIEIIKVHGSINGDINDFVITQSDYEDFFVNKPALVQRLKVELLQKMFVFIGYNYGDPNIQNILIEVRRLKSDFNSIKHYILLKEKKKDKKFQLWCQNLERYNIYPVLFDEYRDLRVILKKISLKARGKSVFVTGSHLNNDSENLDSLSRYFIENEIILVNGQSQGIMESVFRSFTTLCTKENIDYKSRLKLFANPYAANPRFADDLNLLTNLKEFRTPLMKATRVVIAFDGRNGTCAELDVAIEKGCEIIPYFKDEEFQTWQYLDKIDGLSNDYKEKIQGKSLTIFDLIIELESKFK
ncbi:SIR2 family protein [Sphingobacterium sp. WM]|uniref:SIR2 family protein n=1 Tax=Sphingobacterium sp. WM TaxID=3031802 RepID=UPI00240CEA2A|nr:SIR2 family protein [Sphingobacterium sp. WM]WFB62128.1 SIR2 family protein [Sphingobacterium sp. WM]